MLPLEDISIWMASLFSGVSTSFRWERLAGVNSVEGAGRFWTEKVCCVCHVRGAVVC